MPTAAFENWKPGKTVRFWAWISTLSLVAGAWIGAAFLLVVQPIAVGVMAVAFPVMLIGLFRFWQEVGRAEEIPPKIRRQLRQNAVLFGPVAALQLLIYSRFPNSAFSGLRDSNG